VAGTAVHRVLEDLRLGADLASELARQRDRLPGLVDGEAPGPVRAAALARAQALLAKLAAGPFAARLAALEPHVVARELPVLLPPEPDGEGPVGCVAGAIDLLYREPATGELVVVDYKTDAVEGEAALRERAARYAGQAGAYRRAVREALALERAPRCELWFLHAGAVVPVD
jgi:ATP-dependent exoDNAse (exonuclease V) beta subunit